MSKRASNKSWSRYAAILFAAFILNLVLQPCAMAMDFLGQCPDCPRAAGHGSMTHHVEAQAEAASGEPCATGDSGCSAAEGYRHEQRGCQLKLKDGPAEADAIAEAQVFLPVSRQPASPQVCRRTLPFPGAPSLNVLYCVYLK